MEHTFESPKFSTPEQELTFLREQIFQKEKELRERDIQMTSEAVTAEQISRYRNMLPKQVLEDSHTLSKVATEAIVLNLSPETHDSKMEELVGILQTKGLKNVMSVLAGLKDPHIEDDFHRFLVQYIQHDKKGEAEIKKPEFRGVGMVLYEVVLPQDDSPEEGRTKGLKELLSGMEQFFAGMLSIADSSSPDNYMVLEIANPNGSDQFIFFAAVPRTHKELFEKQVISIFHDAKISEATDDYNIFNTDGITLGSSLEFKEKPLYSFKTYEQFDTDPLNVIMSSFSKIEKEGEGAAMQVVFYPRGDYFNIKYKQTIESIEKGVPLKEALDNDGSTVRIFKQALKGLFGSPQKDDESDSKKQEKQKAGAEAIEKIKVKIRSHIVATNIRLVVSGKSRISAEKILNSMESAFNQFADTNSNSLVAKRVPDGKLATFLREFSFRVYNPANVLPMNLQELTTLMHFHTSALGATPQLKQSQSVSAPAPSDVASSGTLLGTNSYRNVDTSIYMQEEDRLRHFYVIGQTGTGKTVFLKNMIIQDIKAGKGCCFIDPHGSDVQAILATIPPERFNDVIYFDPSYTEKPMALNMLEYDPKHPEQKTFVVNELFSIFQKLYGGNPESMGPMFEQYFRNAAMLVIEDPETGSTLLEISRVMTNKEFRDLKISRCKNPIVVQFWREVAEKAGGEGALANIVPYITSKFDVFLANDIMRPIIAQQKSSFDFRDIMDNKKILLVNLSKGRLGDINANLIGLILVGKILMAALSRVDVLGGEFPPFYLYIDEFQNITTNSISTILSEARKYKLSLNIAHQFIAQLQQDIRDAVFGNVGSMAVFRVGAEDAEFLEKQLSPVFTAKDIMNIDNLNAYIKMLVGGKSTKAFNIKEPYPPKGDPSIVENLKQLSYMTYGGDRDAIEKEILAKYKK